MPNISIMTPEVEDSVIRPSILGIINQLKEVTGIPKETKVLYTDYLRAGFQRGSAMNQQVEDSKDRTSFSFGDQLAIEVKQSYEEGNVNSTAVKTPEHIPIFDDSRIGVFIKPIYFKYNFSIAIRYRSKSPSDGKRWRDAIRLHRSNMRDILLHDIEYHYPFPTEALNILTVIHELREKVDGYGESLVDWLAANSTTRFTSVVNQAGKQSQLVVAEKQMRVLGQYDFNIAPEEGEPDSEGRAWTTTFNYNVSFDVPVAVNMKYPFMIHNQLIPEPYASYNQAYDIEQSNKAYSNSLGALSHFESTSQLDKIKDRTNIVRIPEFDEFLPTSKVHGTQPIISVLCEVDPDNKKILLNLKELGDYSIDSDILEFLKGEYSYLTLPYKSIFHISLYKWTALSSDKRIYVNEDLDVLAHDDLSLRINNRVMVSIVSDITYLDRDALLRLKRHKSAANKILKAIAINRGTLNLVAHKVNLNSIIDGIPESGINLRQLQKAYYQFNTVNTSMILAFKKQ